LLPKNKLTEIVTYMIPLTNTETEVIKNYKGSESLCGQIFCYLRGFQNENNDFINSLNQTISNFNIESIDNIDDFINTLDLILSKSNIEVENEDEPKIVYRGTYYENIIEFDNEFQSNYFMSTSKVLDTALKFINQSADNINPVLLKIELKKGDSAFSFKEFDKKTTDEKEFLLARNSKFRIKKKVTLDNVSNASIQEAVEDNQEIDSNNDFSDRENFYVLHLEMIE